MAGLLLFYGLILVGLSTMLVDRLGWIAFAVYYLGMPAGAAILRRVEQHSDITPGLRPLRSWRLVVGGSIAAAGSVMLLWIVMALAGWIDIVRYNSDAAIILVGILVQQMFVAVVEEFTFRGVLQPLLAARLGRVPGLVGCAILFGAFHLPNIIYHHIPAILIPLTILSLTFMGLIFGWAYERTGGHLALPFVLHWFWNVASFGLPEITQAAYTGPRWLIGVPEWFPESGVLGGVGLGIVGVAVWFLTGRESVDGGHDVRSTAISGSS